jgi:hypothetical protein
MSTLALPLLQQFVPHSFSKERSWGILGLKIEEQNNTIINDRIFLSFYLLSKIMKPSKWRNDGQTLNKHWTIYILVPNFCWMLTVLFTFCKVCCKNCYTIQHCPLDFRELLFKTKKNWIAEVQSSQGCESRRQTFSSITRPTFREIWKVSALPRSLTLLGKKVSPGRDRYSVFRDPTPPRTRSRSLIANR